MPPRLPGLDGLDGVVWKGTAKTTLPRFDTLLPSDPVFPNAMTADGSAFIWSEASGLRRVSDLAIAAGLEIPANVVLMNVTGASTDGTVLIGTARNIDTFADHVFTLRLPRSAIH